MSHITRKVISQLYGAESYVEVISHLQWSVYGNITVCHAGLGFCRQKPVSARHQEKSKDSSLLALVKQSLTARILLFLFVFITFFSSIFTQPISLLLWTMAPRRCSGSIVRVCTVNSHFYNASAELAMLSAVLAIVNPSVCLSVCHSLALCQNDLR